MNIFYLDEDPVLAAQAQCDKHVVKMILESAQLLCTTHHLLPMWKDPLLSNVDNQFPDKFYKATHINHPCAIWVRQCSGNYCWLAQHVMALCKEYTYRYDKIHATQSIAEWCLDHIAADHLGYGTDPPQCMPEEYKEDNVVDAYHRYYNECKRNTIKMTWTKRNPPKWWEK